MKLAAKHLLTLNLVAAAVALGQTPADTGGGTPSPTDIAWKMGMRNVRVHDPSTIAKCGDEYYVYATGMPMFHSKDMVTWTPGPGPTTGLSMTWPAEAVPRGGRGGGGGNYWAPDVKVKDKYFIFLSASAFGVNTSGIGGISSPTLNPDDPAYKWSDGGLVVKSETRDNFN